MPKGSILSEKERGKILAFHEEGLSNRKIAIKINRSEGVIRSFLKNPSFYGQCKKGGPKQKLTSRDKRRIINAASNSTKSAVQIIRELGINVSRWTVNRVLKASSNIVRQKLKNAPRLLPRHKKARLEFARTNMQTDWKKVRIIL